MPKKTGFKYKPKGPFLLSKGERVFFDVLIQSISPDLYVCPKVRIADLIEVDLPKNEFKPQDFIDFQNNQDAIERYGQCADRCLLFNFGGAIPPAIQGIITDKEDTEGSCESCLLDERERKIAILLLIDALL